MGVIMNKLILVLFSLLATLTAFAANPSYTAFRGTGGIEVTTNPPTGLIVIDGSGVFTSSGTNATISTSTNGVLVAVASTNINFIKGTNVVLTATNIGSVTHIGVHAVTPPEEKTISTKVNGTTISLVTTQLNMEEGINTVLAPGTNSPAGNVSVGFNLRPNLRFFPGANEMVLGSWGNVFGVSNAVTGDLSFYNSDPGAGDDWVFGGLISAVNANLSLLAGSGDIVAISPGGTLLRTNITQELIVNAVSNLLLTLIIYIPELRSSNIVVTNIVSPNISAAPPISSVQYNSNGFIRGSSEFLFTNGVATVGQGVEVTTGSFVLNGGTTALVAWNGLGRIRWDSDGVMRLENDSASGFNRVNIGGNTAASPAFGVTNGDAILLGANGAFGGVATNKLYAPGVYIVNSNSAGTAQLRLENLSFASSVWDFAVDSNPETTVLGLRRNSAYLVTFEPAGNVGFGTTNPANRVDIEGRVAIGAAYSGSSIAPTDGLIVVGNVGIFTDTPTNRLDVNGHVSFRTNLFLPNLPTNGSPVAFLAVDGGGMVYETAAPAGGSGITSINEDTTANHTISLSTNLTQPIPHITNSPGGFTLINIPWAAVNVSGALHSNDFKRFTYAATNAVLTNLVGTVGKNVTNVISLSTSNATSKPITNAYGSGTLTLFGLEAGANVTVTPNGSNLVIAATGGSFSVSGNSNQIPYLNMAGTGFLFGATNRNNPGFGFSKAPNEHNGALMIHEDETNVYSLVAIGHPTLGSSIPFFCPSLTISNRYSYSGSGDKVTQEMVRVTFVDITDGSDPESFIQTWEHADDASAPVRVAGLRRDGRLELAHGTYYPSNALAVAAMPTAAQLGPGGYWVGNSNASLVSVYSLNGTTTSMKVLAP